MVPEPAGLSISAVAEQTGIPVSTLRFYERELPGLFHIRKTSGGHRRYGVDDIARFAAVRKLTEIEGLGLADVRQVLMSRGDSEALREDVERVRASGAADGQALRDLARRVDTLESRIAALEAGPPRRRWLGSRRPGE